MSALLAVPVGAADGQNCYMISPLLAVPVGAANGQNCSQ